MYCLSVIVKISNNMTMFKSTEGIVKKYLTEKIITSSKLVLIYQTPLYFLKLG